jgi:hypothetical protein
MESLPFGRPKVGTEFRLMKNIKQMAFRPFNPYGTLVEESARLMDFSASPTSMHQTLHMYRDHMVGMKRFLSDRSRWLSRDDFFRHRYERVLRPKAYEQHQWRCRVVTKRRRRARVMRFSKFVSSALFSERNSGTQKRKHSVFSTTARDPAV